MKNDWENAKKKLLKQLGLEQDEQSGLEFRLNEIERCRKLIIDSANLLYIAEFLTSESYLAICDRINTDYDLAIQNCHNRYDELKAYTRTNWKDHVDGIGG